MTDTTPPPVTDDELLALAGRLHTAYVKAEPGHRLLAAAKEAAAWADLPGWQEVVDEADKEARLYRRLYSLEAERSRLWKQRYARLEQQWEELLSVTHEWKQAAIDERNHR